MLTYTPGTFSPGALAFDSLSRHLLAVKEADHVADRARERSDVSDEEIAHLRAHIRRPEIRERLDKSQTYHYVFRGSGGDTRAYAVIGPVGGGRTPDGKKTMQHVVKTVLSKEMHPPGMAIATPTSDVPSVAPSNEKAASTRQVREIRKLVEAGNIDKARALAAKLEEAKVLKRSDLGTTVQRLGAGREGVAHMVLGANDSPIGHEIAVRKSYDPTASLFNPQFPDRKVQIGGELRRDNGFAEMFTKDNARRIGNVPYHISEYVDGIPIAKMRPDGSIPGPIVQAIDNTIRRGNVAAQSVLGSGAQLRDIRISPNSLHGDNTRLTPHGAIKVIDYIPASPRDGSNLFPQMKPEHYEMEKQVGNLARMGKHQEAGRFVNALNAKDHVIIRQGYHAAGGSRQAPKPLATGQRYVPQPPKTITDRARAATRTLGANSGKIIGGLGASALLAFAGKKMYDRWKTPAESSAPASGMTAPAITPQAPAPSTVEHAQQA